MIRVRPRKETREVVGWKPKDHERREIPIPRATVDVLARLQAQAPEGVPHVFITAERYELVQQRRGLIELKKGQEEVLPWRCGEELLNNALRDLKLLSGRAKVATEGPALTWHAIRKSCITNWAGLLPMHVAKEYAGHASIATTEKYYLKVTKDQQRLTRRVMQRIVAKPAEKVTRE